MTSARSGWQFWIDRGGTFTDLVGLSPEGELVTHKLLSSHKRAYDDAALQGMRDVLGIASDQPLTGISSVRMGTTVATNALLERRGEPVLLAITEGFADALQIGYQNRPRLFDRHIVLPEPLYSQVLEIPERISADGQVVRKLNEETVSKLLAQKRAEGLDSIAITCLHGYRYPAHEARVAELARDAGFSQVSTGHEVSQLWKLIPRSDTAVVEGYLASGLRRYVHRVSRALPETPLQFMQSSGGLIDATRFHARNAILSGPAGGIVGAVHAAQAAGLKRIITFDMGGTSTDVAHFSGRLERTVESEVAGIRLRAPMLSIHTVAAGGGSICQVRQGRLQVGPGSAGAEPGPAAYGRGGPATITDCNLLLGRIRVDHFPAVFGPERNQPLDLEAARLVFTHLAASVYESTGARMTLEEIALGCLRIAVDNMANAIKKISVQRGYDPRDYTLVTFGGAGGQHACDVADALGMSQVLLHPLAGVLSAYGIGMADVSVVRQMTLGVDADSTGEVALRKAVEAVRSAAEIELSLQATAGPQRHTILRARLRYVDSDSGLLVNLGSMDDMRHSFEKRHRDRYGFVQSGVRLVIDSVEAEATASDVLGSLTRIRSVRSDYRKPSLDPDGKALPVLFREAMEVESDVSGPRIIMEPNSTIFVKSGWSAVLQTNGSVALKRIQEDQLQRQMSTACDPVLLEVFNNLFMSIAEQMGFALQTTAHSVNIKERLDFSCGIFDTHGHLVANAPHMPVHLGSMGESVAAVIKRWADEMRPGDAFVLNAPYGGGTHLPDITIVTPVFAEDNQSVEFFLASRGHHADVGGMTPGSMPAESQNIGDEGVLFSGERIVSDGQFQEAAIRELLASGAWPARNPDQNVADLKAQIAANQKGRQEIERMVQAYGLHVVRAYMQHVQDNAEDAVREALSDLREGAFVYPMDGGAEIRVNITIQRESDGRATGACVDFSGTSAQRNSNYNAPRAVCRAAVLYVFRTLVDADIPMNEGCLRPIELVVPVGCLLHPQPPAAVVAGNVETSQCIVDALYGALGVMAGAQGTMNNTTFGTQRVQYYETVCGGSGAGPDFAGTSAIQTHMTNSRLTDPEVLESRFPVRLEHFRIRRRSGGGGRYNGGDGVRRELTFLEPMTLSFLSSHRRVCPFGIAGGEPGLPGRQWILRRDGRRDPLAFRDQRELNAGDRFVLETPGGGGFGSRLK